MPLGLILLELVLCVVRLGRRDFWYDEVVSASAVSGPGALASWIPHDPFDALYYVLLYGWSVFGADEVALRAFSVVCAVASVPVIYAVTVRLFDRRTALVAGLVMGANAFLLHYGQEARPYALAFLLSATATLALLRADERSTPSRLITYGLLAVVGVYVHLFVAFVVLAHAVWLVGVRRMTGSWAATFGIIALLVAPVGLATLAVSTLRLSWIPETTLASAVDDLRQLTGGFDAPVATALAVAYGVAIGIGLIRIARAPRPVRERRLLVASLLVITTAVPLAISRFHPIVVDRYLIVALPAMVMCAAAGLTALRPRAAQAAALAALLLLAFGGVLRQYTMPFQHWREAAALLRAGARSSDVVTVMPATRFRALDYYAARLGGSVPGAELVDPAASATVAAARGGRVGGDRIWILIVASDPMAGEDAMSVEARLEAAGYRMRLEETLGDVDVTRWDLTAQASS